MRDIEIAPQVEGKGRTFRAVLLASVRADLFWPGGMTATDNERPVWAMFAGSEQELRAFMANLTSGRKADMPKPYGHGDDRMEILRSAGFQTTWQREAEGSIATVFLPELFQLDPGLVDPAGIKFIILPTGTLIRRQVLDVKPLVRHAQVAGHRKVGAEFLEMCAPLAYIFCAYLDRRTRCPLVSDGRFYMQLFLACLKKQIASFSTNSDRYRDHDLGFGHHPSLQFFERDTATIGLLPGVAFRSSHDEFEKLLAEQVSLFFQLTGTH